MRFEIVTIFPEFFTSIFENGILRRALAEGLVSVGVYDLRAFTHDRHRTVDDRPFGGGEGMVLKPEPLAEALAALGIAPKAEMQKDPQAAESISSEGGGGFNPRIAPTDASGALAPETHPENLLPGSVLYQGATGRSGFQPRLPQIQQKERGALAPEEKGHSVLQEASGHDFSRAENAAKSTGALAPEGNSPDQTSFPNTRVILLSAQGRSFTQAMARELATTERVVLICGRYEGVDERINQLYCDMELSIGDYVLSGGELAAAVVVDATMRLVPGVLGNEASGDFESFGVADAEIASAEDGVPRSQHGAGGLLDYPHYTRPAEFGGLRVPETLLNGDHAGIRRWRREQQLRKTLTNRPDLLAGAALSKEDKKLLEAIRQE
jgi:tRNA (guanine37-N1)-methyltransferase